MSNEHLLADGTYTTQQTIMEAFKAGKARLLHSRNPIGGTITGLVLNGLEVDIRNPKYSVWDEIWTTTPASIEDCYKYSKV